MSVCQSCQRPQGYPPNLGADPLQPIQSSESSTEVIGVRRSEITEPVFEVAGVHIYDDDDDDDDDDDNNNNNNGQGQEKC